jgi:rRNA small subunit pseudouridine methyltransferase Nep1
MHEKVVAGCLRGAVGRAGCCEQYPASTHAAADADTGLYAAPDASLQVIKGPVSRHLPVGAPRIGFSPSAESLQDMHQYASSLSEEQPVVFVVGAFAHGEIDTSYVDKEISISQYSLSAAYALARITTAMEAKWGIL